MRAPSSGAAFLVRAQNRRRDDLWRNDRHSGRLQIHHTFILGSDFVRLHHSERQSASGRPFLRRFPASWGKKRKISSLKYVYSFNLIPRVSPRIVGNYFYSRTNTLHVISNQRFNGRINDAFRNSFVYSKFLPHRDRSSPLYLRILIRLAGILII